MITNQEYRAKKVIVWGTGAYYQKYKGQVEHQLAYFADSNAAKTGTELDGKLIYLPEQLLEENKDEIFVCVMSMYYKEIYQWLEERGIYLPQTLLLMGGACVADKLVSVLMTIYNNQDYIVEALESVLDMDYKRLEFILVDDGSTDRSIELVAPYMAKDSRIRLYCHEKNMGVPRATKTGIQHCQGEYILFCCRRRRKSP
ncbi:glycosyltransferase family 2 protein [Cohnella rhizosphaerae]|uniref:Glycosyltransferase n=1 Tax=Cohnella rhizosphaerae TaxID=1457232 RepID=A0A9X4QUM4_9BACL|nr:glycosyltransferase family 2 protein [Cohnella rhizosphaerae]MDG0811885.1 glycosyltransferase [Cohnella rhizosphaerae]